MYKKLEITFDYQTSKFHFGEGLFYPAQTEKRTLDDVRKTLMNPESDGPEVLYSIAMDVGKLKDKRDLENRHLLYEIVAYNHGLVGAEPVRSQGHIHSASEFADYSTPEVYEILEGRAIIYMQEFVSVNIGRCYAVYAKAGEIVIVPPGWAHFTVNADVTQHMVFGAWCIRDYDFEYDEIRARKGLAFYPVYNNEEIKWKKNKQYKEGHLKIVKPRTHHEFGLTKENIYLQYENDPNKFDFVTNPKGYLKIWKNFEY